MKSDLRVRELEDRLTPAVGVNSGYETYAWALINNLRQDPAAFANNIQGLVNGSVGSAFGFDRSDPVVTDLKALINRASNPGNYGAALSLMRSTPGAGPLAWDNLLQGRAETHNAWMKANGFAHTEATGTRTAILGFSKNDSAPADNWGYGWPTYSTWGEDIAWAVGSLSSSKAAYNAGSLTAAGLYQRAAFLDTVGYVLELNSGGLGHLENLLGRDSGSSAALPSYNAFGADTQLYEAPGQYEVQDGVPEAWISTHRFGLYRPNGTGGFVTGLAYTDANGNGFYDSGEGQAVTVDIRTAGGQGVTDTANPFGAFADYLPNGTYTVTASANGAVLATRTVTVSNSNAWADLSAGSLDRPALAAPASAQATLRPTVGWSPVDGATAYQVRMDDLTANLSDLFPSTATTATSWAPPADLVSGHRYDVLVRALQGTAPGPWSSPDLISVVTPTPTGPGRMPATLRPTFSWTGVAGATYQVRVNDLSGRILNVFPDATTTATSWTAPADLVSGRVYQWQVRAVNAAGLGAWSPLSTFRLARPTPNGPPNGVTAMRPALSWTPVGGAAAYVVTVNDATANQPAIYTARTTNTVWTPPADLVSGRVYTWQVRALNASDRGAWSNRARFALGRVVLIGPGDTSSLVRPTFTWAGLSGATTYQVRVDDLTAGQPNVLSATVSMAQAWTPGTDLVHGHAYRWRVRAVNAGGLGMWSLPKDFQVL